MLVCPLPSSFFDMSFLKCKALYIIMSFLVWSFRRSSLLLSYYFFQDFHTSSFGILSYNKSPQVSRTFLSILAELNNAVVWMVSAHSPISNSSSSFTKPLRIVPSAPITIGITITFHYFFSSLARSKYLPLFSFCLIFILWLAGMAKFMIW